ncbi:hypothetical protein ENBRE01_3427 [Enteropsectra breve]|nr:hypothetical protein ENBRE01_3427 [Enteropsectra breve]
MNNGDQDLIELLMLLDSSSSEINNLFYSTEWLENIAKMTPSQFQETFRMTQRCFENLVEKIRSINALISNINAKMSVFIFYISHVSTYRKLREIFGISHATLHRIISEISIELHNIAVEEICFPQPEEYESLKNGFASLARIEGAILAIDGTQIKICRPEIAQPFDYYNRKSCFSITFVCVVDHLQRFRGITYGFGKSHDARIYRSSNLRNLIEGITDDSCYAVGDSAFSGCSKIQICASTIASPLTDAAAYNLSKQRIIVENAFGRFKGKFKRFETRIRKGDKISYAKIIKAAMWIHNFIIDNS